MYFPTNLKLWMHPDSYIGECWPNTYVFLGQHRDSSALERSNFASSLAAIGGESETVTVVRESHWAVGWVEWIAIHADDNAALKRADEIMAALEDYPVVDENDFSQREWDEAADAWNGNGMSYRMEMAVRAGHSMFAARREYPPVEDDNGALQQLLLGC